MALIKIYSIILIKYWFLITTFADLALDNPVFVEEPEDSFIINSKPVTLTCKAKGATRVWFQCDSISLEEIAKREHGQYYVEPETGMRMAESSLELNRNDLDNHKASLSNEYLNDLFQCYCQAVGTVVTIKSRKASVGLSSAPQLIKIEPMLSKIEIGSNVSFTCKALKELPNPKIYWLKNGKILKLKQSLETNSLVLSSKLKSSKALDVLILNNGDSGKGSNKNDNKLSNYIVTKNNTLVIKSVSLSDQANFSCVIVYKAHSLKSEMAQLVVFANGGWSQWSSWSNCSVACGSGTQKRVRYCNNPPAINDGASCVGNSTQIQSCISICDPIDGKWSTWSSWTPCSSDCQQSRKRLCNNPFPQHGGQPCLGSDLSKKNCTGGLCRKSDYYRKREKVSESTLRQKDDQNYDLFLIGIIIMATALLCFAIFIFVFMRHRRYKFQSSLDTRYNEEGQAMLLLMQQGLKQTPDLIRNGDGKLKLISRHNNYNTNLLDHFIVRDEHYNSPNFETCLNTSNNHSSSTSATTIISTPKAVNITPNIPTVINTIATASITSEDDNNESEPDYAEPMISNSPYFTTERKPPLPSSCPPGTKLEKSLAIYSLLKFIEITEDISNQGFFSFAPEMGIGVYIPPNSFNISSSYSSTLHFGIDPETKICGLSSLTPIFVFGSDKLIEFNRPVVIIIKHCLTSYKSDTLRNLSILWSEKKTDSKNSDKWIEILRYGQENLNTCLHANFDKNFLYLMSNLTGKFVLIFTKQNIKDTKDEKNFHLSNQQLSKKLNFSCSSESFSCNENLLRVYLYNDLPISKINLTNETNSNCLLTPSSLNNYFNILDNNQPLTIEIIEPNDKFIKGTQKAEISSSHIWNSGPNSIFHCSFIIFSNFKQFKNRKENKLQIKISQKNKNGDFTSNMISFTCKKNDKNVNQNVQPQILVHTYGHQAIDYRIKLSSKLNLPRSDFKDWRGLASLCELTHYLPYFASRHNPTSHLFDLWEAKIITSLILNHFSQTLKDYQYSKNEITRPFEIGKINEMIKMQLIQILYNLERNDLVLDIFQDYHHL